MKISEYGYAAGPADPSTWVWYLDITGLPGSMRKVPAPEAADIPSWKLDKGSMLLPGLEWPEPVAEAGGRGAVSIVCAGFRKELRVAFLSPTLAKVEIDFQEKGNPSPDAGWILDRLRAAAGR